MVWDQTSWIRLPFIEHVTAIPDLSSDSWHLQPDPHSDKPDISLDTHNTKEKRACQASERRAAVTLTKAA